MKAELIEKLGEDYISVIKQVFPFVESYDDLERMWRHLHQSHSYTVSSFVNYLMNVVDNDVVIEKIDLTRLNITEVNKVFPNIKTHSDLIRMYTVRYDIALYDGYDIFRYHEVYGNGFVRHLAKYNVQV